MAVAFQTSGTASSASVATTVIPKPTGLAAGDLMVAHLSAHNNTIVYTDPGGWTKDIDFAPTGQAVVTTTMFYKVADSTDAAATNFTFTSGGTSRGVGCITRWTGHDGTTPIQAMTTNPATGSSTVTQVANSVSGTDQGALICAYAEGDGGGDPWTAFSGSTGKAAEFDSGGNTASHQSISVQYLLLTTTGATGNQTSTSTSAAFYSGSTMTISPPIILAATPTNKMKRWAY